MQFVSAAVVAVHIVVVVVVVDLVARPTPTNKYLHHRLNFERNTSFQRTIKLFDKRLSESLIFRNLMMSESFEIHLK